MTEYVNTIMSRTEPWMVVPDSEENIMLDLEQYTLDPIFELYGNFVNRNPEWASKEIAEKYAGCTAISGNFLTFSHAFLVYTDDEPLINRLAEAIKKNKERTEYQSARAKVLTKVPVLEAIDKAAGIRPRVNYGANKWPGKYLFNGEVITITRVYRLTEAEANELSLLYLERWEGRDCEGRKIGGAFHDGDKLQSTMGWKINNEEAQP